jgi:predicted Zn-dependent protease
MILGEKEAKVICDQLLSYVKADDATVAASSVDHSHLRYAANAFRTSGRREDVDVTVTVWIDNKKGAASANEIGEASLRGVVEQAEQFARVSPVDREYVPTLGPQRYKPTHGFVEATANLSVAGRARAIANVIATCGKAGVVGAGYHQARGSAQAGATKHGNFHSFRSSLASLSLTARTREGEGSGYFLRNHFDITKLETERIAHQAIQKALRSREPRPLSAGTYPVILEAQAVADLLGFFPFVFDARLADEGRSPFSAPGQKTKIGERIFSDHLNLYSDPWHPELPGSPVAREGVPAEKFYLVRNGVIENLIYSRFWAKQKQKEPSPGPVNVILEGSTPGASIAEMVQDTKKGLLVTRFWYIRPVDPRTAALTGLTRDGLWYIEDGKIQYPVRNFRFNQSILDLLAPDNVDLIGAPERVGNSESQGSSSALLPALKVKAFHLTSQSEAV